MLNNKLILWLLFFALIADSILLYFKIIPPVLYAFGIFLLLVFLIYLYFCENSDT